MAIDDAWPNTGSEHRMVVCTGGKPLLQLDNDLVEALHSPCFYVAVRTNRHPSARRGWTGSVSAPKSGTAQADRGTVETRLPAAWRGAGAVWNMNSAAFGCHPWTGQTSGRTPRLLSILPQTPPMAVESSNPQVLRNPHD